ncbi:MAG: diphthamide biosynthesis enzyme Dph2 [Nanoarchaeota archaeon]|nr:diphthamide biosynthesis enzyme Dph2 [Nanoarchaeota archaeon]
MLSETTRKRLKESHAKRILLQFPEGLKTRCQAIADELTKEGYEVLIACEPNFGACDLRDQDALDLGCDVLLHIGHTAFGVQEKLPVIYEPYYIDKKLSLEKHLDALKPYRTIGLTSSVQFVAALEPAAVFLEQHGKTVTVLEPMLGCRPPKTAVDCYVFIGSGMFHPLGLAKAVDQPVFFLDVERNTLEDLTPQKTKQEKIRWASIAKAQDATNFGILVTTKPGQRSARAFAIKKELEAKEKKAWVLVFDQATPDKIAGLKLDALVNTMCPRLNEDTALFKKPILNPDDIDKL